jgi:hypothetical protein
MTRWFWWYILGVILAAGCIAIQIVLTVQHDINALPLR